MSARFTTLKAVRHLIPGSPGLYRQFRQIPGWGHLQRRLVEIFKLEGQMYQIGWDLTEWSRLHRRLNNGRPAVIDEWLIAHADEIRAGLTALEKAVDELAALNTLSEAQRALVDDYKLDLYAAWRLDLEEGEAHEIARRQPPPKVEAPADAELSQALRNMTSAQRTDVLIKLQSFALEMLAAKLDAAQAAPAPVAIRSWVPDFMTSTPLQRVAGGWS